MAFLAGLQQYDALIDVLVKVLVRELVSRETNDNGIAGNPTDVNCQAKKERQQPRHEQP